MIQGFFFHSAPLSSQDHITLTMLRSVIEATGMAQGTLEGGKRAGRTLWDLDAPKHIP